MISVLLLEVLPMLCCRMVLSWSLQLMLVPISWLGNYARTRELSAWSSLSFRYAEKTDFEQEPSFASIDVSFISLSLILPALHCVLADQGQVVALVKPQFEAGREQIGKNGIIRDAKVHQHVLESVTAMAVEQGFSVFWFGLFSHPRWTWKHRIFWHI